MADIELVIKIPEDLKKMIFNDEVFDIAHSYRLAMCVKNGTPLPKGHGRLIDADKLIDSDGIIADSRKCHYIPMIDVYNASTIIEADEAESEEV